MCIMPRLIVYYILSRFLLRFIVGRTIKNVPSNDEHNNSLWYIATMMRCNCKLMKRPASNTCTSTFEKVAPIHVLKVKNKPSNGQSWCPLKLIKMVDLWFRAWHDRVGCACTRLCIVCLLNLTSPLLHLHLMPSVSAHSFMYCVCIYSLASLLLLSTSVISSCRLQKWGSRLLSSSCCCCSSPSSPSTPQPWLLVFFVHRVQDRVIN